MACIASPVNPDWFKDLSCTPRPMADILLTDVRIPTVDHDLKKEAYFAGWPEKPHIKTEANLYLNFWQLEKLWPLTEMDTAPHEAILAKIERTVRSINYIRSLGYHTNDEAAREKFLGYHFEYCAAFVRNFKPFVVDLEVNKYMVSVHIDQADLQNRPFEFQNPCVLLRGTWKPGKN